MMGVTFRPFLPLLVLALLMTPFGRLAAAEAKAMPHDQAIQSSPHCAGQPQPTNNSGHDAMAIDCMIACAAIAVAADSFAIPVMAAIGPLAPASVSYRAGIRPEAEPPPPRSA